MRAIVSKGQKRPPETVCWFSTKGPKAYTHRVRIQVRLAQDMSKSIRGGNYLRSKVGCHPKDLGSSVSPYPGRTQII
jgi:hypothetical protein